MMLMCVMVTHMCANVLVAQAVASSGSTSPCRARAGARAAGVCCMLCAVCVDAYGDAHSETALRASLTEFMIERSACARVLLLCVYVYVLHDLTLHSNVEWSNSSEKLTSFASWCEEQLLQVEWSAGASVATLVFALHVLMMNTRLEPLTSTVRAHRSSIASRWHARPSCGG
jgi:hypothetical protein